MRQPATPDPEADLDDEAGFLSAIRQTPADDTVRLVYAGWLDERGDPASRAKAGFIRLQLRAVAPGPIFMSRLAAAFDPTWVRTVSDPGLEACPVASEFECPARWDRLTPTADANRRFCESCRRHVHYCATLQEARDHARRGDCVAVSLALARRPNDLSPPAPVRPYVLGGLVSVGPIAPLPPARTFCPAENATSDEPRSGKPPKPPRPPRRDRARNRNLKRGDRGEQD